VLQGKHETHDKHDVGQSHGVSHQEVPESQMLLKHVQSALEHDQGCPELLDIHILAAQHLFSKTPSNCGNISIDVVNP
jgi:hypothetical protein